MEAEAVAVTREWLDISGGGNARRAEHRRGLKPQQWLLKQIREDTIATEQECSELFRRLLAEREPAQRDPGCSGLVPYHSYMAKLRGTPLIPNTFIEKCYS
jgi:hypothetical protein